MYRVVRISVSKTKYPELFAYADNISRLAKNLHNAALFRLRQRYTSLDRGTLNENQILVQNEIDLVEMSHPKYHAGNILSYRFLERMMRDTGNPDYFADGLSKQTAQQILKKACSELKSFDAAEREYIRHPEKFTGRPRIPGYTKSETATFTFTNQDAVIKGRELKLPLTKITLPLPEMPEDARLKQTEVKPYMGRYIFFLTLEVKDAEVNSDMPYVCSIDLGVRNAAAIVCNDGSSEIYKGGSLLSSSRLHAKRKADAVSIITKGHDRMHAQSRHLQHMAYRHECFMRDQLHKISRRIVNFCTAHKAGTIVIGENRGWKYESCIGRVNNQNFHAIAHGILKAMIEYKARYAGITVIYQEESYTSKADFTKGDFMPVYGKENGKPSFSGVRDRGLYICHDGRIVNADLNGAANIMRKAMPEATEIIKDFRFLAEPEVIDFRKLNTNVFR